MKNFRKKGSLLVTTAVSIVSWLFLAYVAFVINTSPFHVLTAVRTAHQAQQYADIIADTLKNTSYDSVTTKAHARQNITSEVPGVTGWQSEVTMSGETTIGESVQRIATIKIYKPGDTLSRYSVQVPLSSQQGVNNKGVAIDYSKPIDFSTARGFGTGIRLDWRVVTPVFTASSDGAFYCTCSDTYYGATLYVNNKSVPRFQIRGVIFNGTEDEMTPYDMWFGMIKKGDIISVSGAQTLDGTFYPYK